MIDIPCKDFALLDQREIIRLLFHPRPEWGQTVSAEGVLDMLIPVEGDIRIGARFHPAEKESPCILFFHGNGEVVSDYDGLGQIYSQLGIGFLPVDYRGYGHSSGTPTVSAMMRDAHVIFHFAREWLTSLGHRGPLIVMGRSLGSASALELASHYSSLMPGLIIESGFARTAPLLELLGVNVAALDFREEQGFQNLDKITRFEKPTLIIHAERDHLIPFQDGQNLYEACSAEDKQLLMIPGADHNDIFSKGLSEYMDAIKRLADSLTRRIS
jgi:alpha-beta hydrolase superfamily lysophospholipase